MSADRSVRCAYLFIIIFSILSFVRRFILYTVSVNKYGVRTIVVALWTHHVSKITNIQSKQHVCTNRKKFDHFGSMKNGFPKRIRFFSHNLPVFSCLFFLSLAVYLFRNNLVHFCRSNDNYVFHSVLNDRIRYRNSIICDSRRLCMCTVIYVVGHIICKMS